MPAHEMTGVGPAHDSTPPRKSKMTYLNVDKTGVSMAPKTVIALIGFIIFIASGWYGFLSLNATKSDVTSHNKNLQAHKVLLEGETKAKPVSAILEQHHKVIKEIPEIKSTVIKVKNGFYEERAERLADRAADKVRGERQSRERWKQVRAKAMKNLENDRPIREGLEDYL